MNNPARQTSVGIRAGRTQTACQNKNFSKGATGVYNDWQGIKNYEKRNKKAPLYDIKPCGR